MLRLFAQYKVVRSSVQELIRSLLIEGLTFSNRHIYKNHPCGLKYYHSLVSFPFPYLAAFLCAYIEQCIHKKTAYLRFPGLQKLSFIYNPENVSLSPPLVDQMA